MSWWVTASLCCLLGQAPAMATQQAPPAAAAVPPPADAAPAPADAAPAPADAAPAPAPAASVASATVASATVDRPFGFRLAITGEWARGVVATGKFTNGLAGARLDWQVTETIALGGYLGYVNLKGKAGRDHGLLPYGQIEYRVSLRPDGSLRWPIRFASGYLPRNGPVSRLGTGLAFPIANRAELVAEVAAMAWMARNQMLLSLNAALSLEWKL